MLCREGRLPVLALAGAGLAAAYLLSALWCLPFWIAGAVAAYVFRLPSGLQTDLPLAVVSPIGGVVASVARVQDPWFVRPALRIGIRLRAPWIGVLFSPADGKVQEYWTEFAGEPAPREGSGGWLESPTRYTLGLVTDAGDPIVYSVSGARAVSRLKFDRAPGERAVRSRRSGFVYFAYRVEVLVPENARAEVRVGQRVRAGSDIIATLVHG